MKKCYNKSIVRTRRTEKQIADSDEPTENKGQPLAAGLSRPMTESLRGNTSDAFDF